MRTTLAHRHSPIKGVLASTFIGLNTASHCVPLYLMGLLRLIPATQWQRQLDRRMDIIIDTWVSGNRWLNQSLGLFDVRITGEDLAALSRDRWYMVVSNHQTWADIIVLQNTFRPIAPPMKFFTKKQLLWLPFLGLAMKLLRFPYVKRASKEQIAANPALKEHDRQATLDACDAFQDHPVAVLNFLEGTRFTPTKHADQQSPFSNLLKPKVGGVGFVVQALEGKLHQLIDVTLHYPTGVPSFFEFLSGACPIVEMQVDLHTAPATTAEESVFREQMTQLINDVWARKDEHLDARRGSLEADASDSQTPDDGSPNV